MQVDGVPAWLVRTPLKARNHLANFVREVLTDRLQEGRDFEVACLGLVAELPGSFTWCKHLSPNDLILCDLGDYAHGVLYPNVLTPHRLHGGPPDTGWDVSIRRS